MSLAGDSLQQYIASLKHGTSSLTFCTTPLIVVKYAIVKEVLIFCKESHTKHKEALPSFKDSYASVKEAFVLIKELNTRVGDAHMIW